MGASSGGLLVQRTVNAVGDTYVKSGSPNQNQGSEPIMRLQSSGKNRGLVFFDPAAIASAVGTDTLTSAKLELQIDATSNNWGTSGRPIAVHRLLQTSAEYSATWNCAQDSSIYNSQADCSAAAGTAWSMDASVPSSRPWLETASATTTIVDNQTGVVQLDVTADIAAILGNTWAGHGFLLKKVDEAQSGQIDFVSRERGPAPRLLLTVDVVQGGGGGSGGSSGDVDAGTLTRRFLTTADTHVRQGEPNHNFGADSTLRLQASGRNRGLVNFDLAAIDSALVGYGLHAARLEMTVAETYDNWGADRSIGVHRLRSAWTEGGATWNCAQDADPTNGTDSDCVSPWVMWAPSLPEEQVAWVDPPTSTTLITSGQTGVVNLDVTRDIACALLGHVPLHGFLVKKEAESQSGRIDFASRESASPPALVIEYGAGAGVSFTEAQCAGGGSGGGSGCTPTASVDDDCDDVDDDCNGTKDEDYAVVVTTCGVGACAASGERSCIAGSVVDSCAAATAGSSDVSCNGVDEDCDGTADEAYASAATSCGVGACAATGSTACTAGVVTNNCTPGTPALTDATCDGVDEDCNGVADDDYVVAVTTCGVGACASTGSRTCANATEQDSCAPGTPTPGDASCNGVDDDCDGQIDDDYVAPPTTCIADGCHAQGHLQCVAGAQADDCNTSGVCVSEADCTDAIDNDHDGSTDCADEADCGAGGECDFPPDPASVAPAIDPSAATPFYDLFSFLTDGEGPIQRDTSPGAITPAHASLIQGHVRTHAGAALGGVLVSVFGRPELGTTRTRPDGNFDLLVVGGGELLLRFEHPGYVTVDRAAHPPWRGSEKVDDVILTRRSDDAAFVVVNGGTTGYQVVRGSQDTDRDGTRRTTLLLAPGTTAQLRSADGSVNPLTGLHVRVTELTVGPGGSNALPAPLPGPSAFLYAANIAVDEAPQGAVELSQPAPLYVENFLDLPIGTELPAASYLGHLAQWVPATNGIALRILGVDGGVATIDANGDGAADSTAALAALGIGASERTVLGGLYSAGQALFRVPLSQLGTWDVSPGPGAMASAVAPPRTNVPMLPAPRHVVDIDVPVAGTEFTLHYSSDRVLGYAASRSLDIDLGLPTALPVRPHHVRLTIAPATGGTQSYRWLVPGSSAPASDFGDAALPANRVFPWTSSGLDLAGRLLQGAYGVEVTASYEYACGYRGSNGFGSYPTGASLASDAPSGPSGDAAAGVNGADRGTCIYPQRHNFVLEQWDQRAVGLGGFSLSVHHVALPDGSVLFGDGGRSTAKLMPVSRTLADPLAPQQPPFNGVPLAQAAIWTTGAIRAGGDGSIFIAGKGPYLHHVAPDGLVTTIAGGDATDCQSRSIVAGSPALDVLSPVCGFEDLALLPDGDIVATDHGRIVRIDTAAGTIEQLNAGPGAFTPDGALVASATLEVPSAIAADRAGRIFLSDCGAHPLIRMIDVDGRLRTVAGNGVWGSAIVRSKVDAQSVPLGCVPAGALEVDERGNIYFAEEAGNRAVLHVDPSGKLMMLGGYDDCAASSCYGHPSGLELDRKGNIFVAQRGEASVFRYTPGDTSAWVVGAGEETVEQVYGLPGELTDPRCNRPAGASAEAFFAGTRSDSLEGIAVSPDGSLYLAATCTSFTSPLNESLPANVGHLRARRLDPSAEQYIASPGRAQYYVFDANGRHAQTRDAATNGVLYTFGYDAAGRLSQVTDGDGDVTAILRDAGVPTAVVAPFAQVTALHANAAGYLDTIRPDPSVPEYVLQYVDDRGLMQTVTTPRGTSTSYGYDAEGRLASTTDPANVTRELAQADGPSARVSTASGPDGTSTVAQTRTGDGRETRVSTAVDGTTTVRSVEDSHRDSVLLPWGTAISRTSAEDPRFGATQAFNSATTTSVPSGLRREYAMSRTATLADPNDPGSAPLVREQTTVNGLTWDTTVDLQSRTRTTISPAGRVHRVTSDAQGRPLRIERPGRSPLDMSYDTHGRIESVASEAEGGVTRSTEYGYSASTGYLASTTVGTGAADGYVRDVLGRVTQWTRPDGHLVSIDYDQTGNVIAITPPGKPAHGMSYTMLGSLETYTPPALQSMDTSTVYEYTPDGKLARVLLPDGRIISNIYGADGKLQTVTTPLGTRTYSYSSTTGGLKAIADSSGATISFGADGHLPNMTVWDGAGHVRGWVRRGYDASFQLSSLTVNGAVVASYGRDPDGFLTSAGPMSITRDQVSGDATATTLGGVSTLQQNDNQGELSSAYASYGGETLYSEEILERDALRRITLRRETMEDVSTEYGYGYDAAGRLSEVFVNGALARQYGYDDNGNRTSLDTPSSSESCIYNMQDRIEGCSDVAYEHNAVGQLIRKTVPSTGAATTYDYDVFGNLRGVGLPDGRQIEYEIDALNRRIGKKVDGVRLWGLLYQTDLAPIAQVDDRNQVVSVFIYATSQHVPDFMVKNGRTYRFMVDHLGAVRMVVNVDTGVVAQRIDYDEWGRVIVDTNPGFQPFGLAGGLYDPDTKLVRFGTRDYDQQVGRWTLKDPVLFAGGSENLYTYVRNDPVNNIDPRGLVLDKQQCIDTYVQCIQQFWKGPCGDCLHYCRSNNEWPDDRCYPRWQGEPEPAPECDTGGAPSPPLWLLLLLLLLAGAGVPA